MYSQNDGRSSSTARASAASTVPHRYPPTSHHAYGGGRGFLGSYGSSSTPSSSLENQRSIEGGHSASSATGTTTTSLFGDPVLPSTRHADLLGGEDLYQNLKNNIELYHAKLYNEQERQRQAERDALFEQYANGASGVGGGGGGGYRAVSAVGGGASGGRVTVNGGVVKPIVGNNVTNYSEMPARSKNFGRTQSAGLGVDLSNSRSNIFDMDLLKQNDWIDFSEHEYQHSLIPTNSRTVADVQQFTGGNITRRIENGVFQNPRAAAAARASRRNSITDSSAYGMRGPMVDMVGDHANGTATFTVLGHGPVGYEEGASALPVGGMHDPSTSSDGNSEFERMMRYGRTDPSTAIIRDKINTGSNFRVSDARQHKNTAFTIINEVLPKSSSFDLAGGNRYSPYRDKHRLASSRILSASSATQGTSNVGFYGYGYGADFTEDGSVSAPHGHRRRFSSSELSLSTIGGRVKDGHPAEGSARTKRPTKSKTSLSLASNPGRRQRGVLEVISKKSTVPSAKVTITQPSEDGRSITPTPSESGLSGTGTDGDRISIPEHQLKNMKLFGYKPFSGRPTLSPVPDKGSMESSQADLKDGAGGSKDGGKKGRPVFNIRGLLMSPRSRDKSKETSPARAEDSKEPSVEKQTKPAGKDPEPQASPPKKRRFNLARAIIESARKGGSTEPEPEKLPKQQNVKEEDSGEKRKMALKMKFGIVRSGVRKDSEGNGVKEMRADGKKGKGAKSVTKSGPGTAATSAKGKKKAVVNKKGARYEEEDDDYFDPYRQREREEEARKSKKSTGGGGMFKSALNYAASFRTRSERVGTAGPGGRRKPADVDLPKGAKGAAKGGAQKGGMEKLTPNARRRDKSAKAGEKDTRAKAGAPGMSGTGRVKSGKAQPSGAAGNRAKSAAGGRGKQLRRSSSAVGLDPAQLRRANKLYEKNQKASMGVGGSMGAGKSARGGKSSSSLIQSKANRHSDNDMTGSSGGLAKSDSRGEMRGKASAKAMDGAGTEAKDRIEKRDSEKSLKKSDSNKSLATMGGKPKKSDSKSSLINKRSDSRSSLHQTAAGGGASGGEASTGGGDVSGADLGGKSPLNSLTEGAPDVAVKSARPTPKLQSKGSLLSLISLKGSKRNLDRGAGAGEVGQRPDTATTAATAIDGAMASSTRLQSASIRNAPGTATSGGEGAAEDMVGSRAAGMNEKPTSTKPLRRMMSRGSLLSIKSIAHARSFTNIRPPTAAGAAAAGADGEPGSGGTMPPQTMQKVQEGSQEHDDTTDTETSHGGGGAGGAGGDGQGSMGVATHELTVAGDGEGEKVSNEYNGEHRMKSPMAEHKQQQGSRSPGMDNVSSANTESMRDRTMGQEGPGGTSNSDEFDEDEQAKCSKCCCACCAPCWTRTCLPFRRCFRSCSSCCGGGRNRLGKRKADGQLVNEKEPKKATDKEPGKSCWERLFGCCRRCRNSKTAPESTAIVQRAPAGADSKPKSSCWQSLNCCASCRRNKSRELVPRSSIDSDPPTEDQSKCRTCWSKLLCCCRPKPADGKSKQIKRHKMEEPVEMETVKCCFCFKRQRPKVKAKPKKKVPVKSTFNCLSCCMMCCKKKGDNQSRRTSNLSKKQSIAPTIPPEDLRPKIDMSLVEHSSLMRGAIPVLPICLAYFCLFLNVVLPGTGTVLSGGLCLCIGKPRFSQHDSIKGRIGSFIINCIVGVSQCFTIIFCVVGWGWAIWWGTIMIRLARQHRKILEMEAAQEEGEEQTTLSNRTGASNPPVALVSKTHRDVETGR
ncbi:protein stum [Anopheles maculipalpis]|uniref:protein stum n=1 Tax=Anopheles maculipalpis TaxID=1496333 RepID=UPI0021590506|nr:protein stum [Anopheles maculipalpis]